MIMFIIVIDTIRQVCDEKIVQSYYINDGIRIKIVMIQTL